MNEDMLRSTKVLRKLGLDTLAEDIPEPASPEHNTQGADATPLEVKYIPVVLYNGEPVSQGITVKGLPVKEKVIPILAGEIVPLGLNISRDR